MCQRAICVWEMDFEYLDQKRLLGGVMPDNTVTKVIIRDKFFPGREGGQPQMLQRKRKSFFGWFWETCQTSSYQWWVWLQWEADCTDRLSLEPSGANWSMSKQKTQQDFSGSLLFSSGFQMPYSSRFTLWIFLFVRSSQLKSKMSYWISLIQ